MINNYFKVGPHRTVPFDDSTVTATFDAFAKATRIYEAMLASDNRVICVWRMPPESGPWDSLGMVGHRSRVDIEADLNEARGKDTSYWRGIYSAAFEELHARRIAVGRVEAGST